MKKLIRLTLLLSFLSASIFFIKAQTESETPSPAPQSSGSSMAYLEKTFPQLTNLYRPELENMHTHYIFAVDVSGSMKKYDDIVTPALKAFSRSLPNGEQVTVIPFGTEAKLNVPGLGVKIEGEGTKQTLETALSTLYINDGYDQKFRANTDVAKAVDAVNATVRNNQDIDMNVIVIITDFLNDLPGQGEVKINDGTLVELNKDYERVTEGKHTRLVAMKLPPMGSGKGFSLDQLKEQVFFNTGTTRKFDIVDAISDQAAISHWFEQLAREIMTEKLKAVIEIDNAKNLNPSLITDIDIDGNTVAEIHWKPNKLYTQIKIDSTYTNGGSDFYFDNNKKVWQVTQDTVIKDLKLGKLKHNSIGFHKYDETLNLGLSLPTPYDQELETLGIDKPIPDTTTQKSGWLWTFWLPFWICVGLVVILIIYLFLVFKAAKRNAAEKFNGKIDFIDANTNVDASDPVNVRNKTGNFTIGDGGTYGGDLKGNPGWSLNITKKTSSPFAFWKYPYYEWSKKSQYVRGGKSYSGKISSHGKNGTSKRVRLDCGTDSDHITHNVVITMRQ